MASAMAQRRAGAHHQKLAQIGWESARSSQHLDGVAMNIRKRRSTVLRVRFVLTRPIAGGRARGAAAILGSDCGGHGE